MSAKRCYTVGFACRRGLRRRVLSGEDVPEWLANHPRRRRLELALLSTPPWVKPAELQAVYNEAARLTELLGREFNVDHIIPLAHPRVCGLNVPWNMRAIPIEANRAKGNAWCQWHGDLFSEPEQFCLDLM